MRGGGSRAAEMGNLRRGRRRVGRAERAERAKGKAEGGLKAGWDDILDGDEVRRWSWCGWRT